MASEAAMNQELSILDPSTPILIVDDSVEFAMVLNRILTGVFGFKSITVLPSTGDALERIESRPDEFKIIFLDFHFPSGQNGGELLSTLAERDMLKEKVVFLMSSDPTAEALQRVVKAGAAGVITKPFDRDELKRKLERARQLSEQGATESF